MIKNLSQAREGKEQQAKTVTNPQVSQTTLMDVLLESICGSENNLSMPK